MKYLLLLSLLVISIFAFSPGHFTPAFIVNNDKAAHLVVFSILSLMMSRSFPAMQVQKNVLLLSLLALAIETIQFLFAKRGFSAEDILYDIAGVLLFVTISGCSKLFLKVFHQ